MAYTGPFSNRLIDNLVHITETKSITTGDEPDSTATPIILDATTKFSKQLRGQVSDNPVADNTQRADNYRVFTPTLRISGVISNDSINLYQWAESIGSARAQQVVKRLEELFTLKKLVTIAMPDGLTTKNCMIESLEISRDKKWSNGFYIEMSAKQVELITEKVLAVADKSIRDSTAKKKSTGNLTGSGSDVTPPKTEVIPATSAKV